MLQGVILVAGVIYLIWGLFFFVSPSFLLSFFTGGVSENLEMLKDNELVGPMYYFLRAIAALLFTSGLAMVLPLFDPLRYRGLIYYNGLLFPLMGSVVLIKNGITLYMKYREATSQPGGAALGRELMPGLGTLGNQMTGPGEGYILMLIIGVLLALIALGSAIGLVLTKRLTKEGVE